MSALPVLGISACLAGEKLRYDGSGKLNRFIIGNLTGKVKLLPVCAEVECGMTVPREPMDLFETDGGIKLLTVDTRLDRTAMITQWAWSKTAELAGSGLSGFIFKSGSPSCGFGSARIHRNGVLLESGVGLFAGILRSEFPDIPSAEDTELKTMDQIENFLEKVKNYKGGALC